MGGVVLQVTFKPDASVFAPGVSFDPDTIIARLRELSFLNAGAPARAHSRGRDALLPVVCCQVQVVRMPANHQTTRHVLQQCFGLNRELTAQHPL
jgi:hypothetical protein